MLKKGRAKTLVYLSLALCIIVSTLAFACATPAPAPSPTPAATPKTAATSTPTPKPAPAPSPTTAPATTPAAGTPRYGGTLRFGTNQDPTTLGNPATQSLSSGFTLTDICLEGLLMLNEKGEPIPWLATGWKMDPAALTLTLNLRQGVKFHDGTDFNAAAVKWNLDQVILAKKPELASVKSIDVVDNYTVRLNLTQMDSLLPVYLGVIRGLMQSPTAYQKAGSTDKERTAWAESHPVGTGPFKFVSLVHDVKITFEKFDGYWQKGKPYLDRIEFPIIVNESTLLASFMAGELDVMGTQQAQNIQLAEKTGKYNLLKGDLGLIGGLEGDSKHPDSPWANLKVRQAAAYAVDNGTFAQTIGLGYWVPTNQFDVPGRWGYNPNVKGYPYNPLKARQLLAEAGYPTGFSTIIYGMPQYATMLAALQGYLAEVGIKAEAQIVTPAKRLEMFSGGGWNGVWLIELTATPSTFANMVRNFTTAVAPTRLASVYIPPEFQSLLDKAITTPDFETQKALVWQLQADMVDKYAFITWIYAQYMPLPMQKTVHNLRTDLSLHWNPWDTWLEK